MILVKSSFTSYLRCPHNSTWVFHSNRYVVRRSRREGVTRPALGCKYSFRPCHSGKGKPSGYVSLHHVGSSASWLADFPLHPKKTQRLNASQTFAQLTHFLSPLPHRPFFCSRLPPPLPPPRHLLLSSDSFLRSSSSLNILFLYNLLSGRDTASQVAPKMVC